MLCSVEGCGSRPFCRGWCVKHYTRWQRHGDPLATVRRPPSPSDATEIWCSRCEQMKHASYFGRRTAQADSRRKGYCRDCEKSYNQSRMATTDGRGAHRTAARKYAQSDKARDAQLRKLYGIGLADYDAMAQRQEGRCAICRTTDVGGNATRWHVDHDHTTGRVRGLLCMKCNLGLGYLGDDPERLINACLYLGAVPTAPIAFFRTAA